MVLILAPLFFVRTTVESNHILDSAEHVLFFYLLHLMKEMEKVFEMKLFKKKIGMLEEAQK
jgi:hypothetical protein